MGRVSKTINITAPKENIWEVISNFYDMSWAPNVITKLDIIGEKKGNEIGAERILNGVFHETLIVWDHKNFMIQYTIDDGPSPISKAEVQHYIGTIQLTEDIQNGTIVEWSSEWQGKDAEVAEFCGAIYAAALNDMKKTIET